MTYSHSKVRFTKIPNSLREPKTDYLLSRRSLIVGDNPTISLTVSVYFLSAQVQQALRSEVDTRAQAQVKSAQLL